jgi:replicative DNA helicase
LLRLGINSKLSIHPQTGKGRDQFHVTISGKTDLTLFASRIGAVGYRRQAELSRLRERIAATTANTNRDSIPREAWRLIVQPAMQAIGLSTRALTAANGTAYNGAALFNSGISRTRAERIAMTVESSALLDLAQSDVFWDSIVSIQPDGVEETFDLTVPGPHNFIASDIFVHNSIEQDADVVMFIYREAYYNKQTDRENITDILIKKHRNGPIGDVELYFHPEQRRFTNLDRFHG